MKSIFNVGTDDEQCGHIVKCLQGLDGKSIGCAHDNPLFDTHEYEVKFTNGTCKKYQANLITKNMFTQVDNEGDRICTALCTYGCMVCPLSTLPLPGLLA